MSDKNDNFGTEAVKKEFETVKLMIELFCHQNHGTKDQLCEACQELLDYTQKRLSKCPFSENKGPCSKCKVHCFQEPYRGKIREVMKYSGPRMLIHHPLKAIKHLIDSKKR